MDRLAPDLLVRFLARIAVVLIVVILGDELAWRGLLLGEAQLRWGWWRGLALVTVLSAAYRLPLLIRMGLIDDVPMGALIYGRELLRALAAPVRIAIVLQLRESQRCVHELVDALGVPQPLVSQHLKILKAAGVVAGERSGREVLYRLADHHLAHIVVDAVAHAGEDTP